MMVLAGHFVLLSTYYSLLHEETKGGGVADLRSF